MVRSVEHVAAIITKRAELIDMGSKVPLLIRGSKATPANCSTSPANNTALFCYPELTEIPTEKTKMK